MASKRYTKDGWVDMARIFDNGVPWNILIGGRQIGKTYGALMQLMDRQPLFFLFWQSKTLNLTHSARRTRTDSATTPSGNPGKCSG